MWRRYADDAFGVDNNYYGRTIFLMGQMSFLFGLHSLRLIQVVGDHNHLMGFLLSDFSLIHTFEALFYFLPMRACKLIFWDKFDQF